jgi:hypothetical protein
MSVVETFELFAANLAEIDPAKMINLKAPEAMSKRLEELIQKKKQEGHTGEETTELERYITLDLLINLAKARALRMLNAA